MCAFVEEHGAKMYLFVFLSLFVSGAVGQVIKEGECDYTNIGGYVTNLNFTGMLGTWNQIARFNNGVELGECSSMTLEGSYDASGSLIGVQATWLEVINKTKSYHNGTITAQGVVDGLFNLNMTDYLNGPFVVQSTNYTSYAILYSCFTLTPGNETVAATKLVAAWQFHRETEVSSTEQASMEAIVNLNPDLNGTEWKYISHNKTACGNNGVSLAVPHVLIILATLFMGKEFL